MICFVSIISVLFGSACACTSTNFRELISVAQLLQHESRNTSSHEEVLSFMKENLFQDGHLFSITSTDTFEISSSGAEPLADCVDKGDGTSWCVASVENITFEQLAWVSHLKIFYLHNVKLG